jgi:hypothetical protein
MISHSSVFTYMNVNEINAVLDKEPGNWSLRLEYAALLDSLGEKDLSAAQRWMIEHKQCPRVYAGLARVMGGGCRVVLSWSWEGPLLAYPKPAGEWNPTREQALWAIQTGSFRSRANAEDCFASALAMSVEKEKCHAIEARKKEHR